jgi:hypothetical protein
LPQDDERYGFLIGLGDETLPSHAIDQRAILAGVSLLEQVLEKAICYHFRSDLSETDRNRLFIGGDGGPGILSTFNARIDVAHALGVLSEYAADDMRILQAIRNHFAHARLLFSFESEEVKHLLALLHRRIYLALGLAQPFTLVTRSLVIYVIARIILRLTLTSPEGR